MSLHAQYNPKARTDSATSMRRVGVLIALLALALGGCAAIPTSGAVNAVPTPETSNDARIRYTPVGPEPGASPEEIVRGFLDAMLAYPMTTVTASQFLTPQASQTWRGGESTIVYRRADVSALAPRRAGEGVDSGADAEVRVAVGVQTSIDEVGRLGPDLPVEVRLNLTQVDGQWRITNPPPGRLVTTRFFQDYYRALGVYFFDQAGRRVVPEMVHLPIGDQLPAALMSALAQGPEVSRALQTYLPGRSTLRPSVTVDADGVADVAFDADLESVPRGRRTRLLAQVVWTLRQIPGITGVRVSGGGVISIDGADPVTTVSDVGAFGPPSSDAPVCAVSRGRLIDLQRPGRIDTGAPAPRARAVACDGSTVAIADDEQISFTAQTSTTTASPSGSPETAADAMAPVAVSNLSAMSWDIEGRLWVLDDPRSPRLRLASPQRVREIPTPFLRGIRVSGLAVSNDGGHVAVLGQRSTGRLIAVGSVVKDRDGRIRAIAGWRVVAATSLMQSVAWSDQTTIEYIGRGPLGDRLERVHVDGSPVALDSASSLRLPGQMSPVALALAGVPVRARWILDSDGSLWYADLTTPWTRTDQTASILGRQ